MLQTRNCMLFLLNVSLSGGDPGQVSSALGLFLRSNSERVSRISSFPCRLFGSQQEVSLAYRDYGEDMVNQASTSVQNATVSDETS